MEHAKQYFDNHNHVDKLYFTSDGLAFFDHQNATNHAAQLDDKAITSRTRDEIDREIAKLTDSWDSEGDLLDEPDAE